MEPDRDDDPEQRLLEGRDPLPGIGAVPGIGFWDPEEDPPELTIDALLDGIRLAAEKRLAPSEGGGKETSRRSEK